MSQMGLGAGKAAELGTTGYRIAVGTVTKALELLEVFTRQAPRIGLSELARLSGTNKATCFRLLSELQGFGLVEQDETTRDYRLGPAVLRLAALREASVPYREVTRALLDRLAHDTGESAHSSVLVGERLQMMDFTYSTRHATRVIFDDTNVLPFHATSSGMAVLAFLPAAVQDRVLAQPLAAVTGSTETDHTRLRAALLKVRENGFSVVHGGFETDVVGIAAPVFGAKSECIGALAVTAPAARITPAAQALIIPKLIAAAGEATQLVGGTLPFDLAAQWRRAPNEKDAS